MEVDENYFPEDEQVLLDAVLKQTNFENTSPFHTNSSSIFWQIIVNSTQNIQFPSNATEFSMDLWNRTKFFIKSDHWIDFWNSDAPIDMYYKTISLYYIGIILFLLFAILISKIYHKPYIAEATRLQLQMQEEQVSSYEAYTNSDKERVDWNNFDTPKKPKSE